MTTISERLADKIEITILKIQQLQTVGDAIAAEQRALIEAARQEVHAAPDAIYDHATKTFVATPRPFRAPEGRQHKRLKSTTGAGAK